MARMTGAAAVVLLASAGLGAALAGPVQQTAETELTAEDGGELFKTYCGSCHGKSAKGDGPLARHLRVRPPDLTLLARRAGGEFDADRVYRIIDGRKPVAGHGGPDMPVWGDMLGPPGQVSGSENAVKARIQAIVKYLESIQVRQANRLPTDPGASETAEP